MGQAAVPLYLALGSAGVAEVSNRKTARKRDRIAAAGIRRQSEIEKRAKVNIDDSLKFAEESSTEPFRSELQDKFLQAVRREQALGLAGTDRVGGVSDEFNERAESGAGRATKFGDQLASLFARIDAPGRQREAENFEFGDLGSNLGILGRESRAERGITERRIGAVKPNIWLNLLSAALGGASRGVSANTTSPASDPPIPAGVMDPESPDFISPFSGFMKPGSPGFISPYLRRG